LLQALEIGRELSAPAELQDLLLQTATRMLAWLKAMTFSDGSWPAVNDSVAGIAPPPAALFKAAGTLGIAIHPIQLTDSGYRMIRMPDYELFIDVDGIRPSWQPGHAHADTGNFCLHVRGQAVIVDSGCSGYEDPVIRMQQRGTAAHNTIRINGRDSSEVWSRFRVGRRCRVLRLEEDADCLSIQYVDVAGNRLKRTFLWNETGFEIRDERSGNRLSYDIALHFAPGIALNVNNVGGLIEIGYKGVADAVTKTSEIAGGFNISLSSACLLLSGERYDPALRITTIPK